jgi:hypothetical protein
MATAEILTFQIHHIFHRDLFIDDERSAALEALGITENMIGNKLALVTDATVADVLKNAGSFIHGLLDAAGWGFARHGGGHTGYNTFIETSVDQILNSSLPQEAKRLAILDLHRFAKSISDGTAGLNSGIDVYSSNESLVNAYREFRIDYENPAADRVSEITDYVNRLDTNVTDGDRTDKANPQARYDAVKNLAEAAYANGLIDDKQYENVQEKLAKAATYPVGDGNWGSYVSSAGIALIHDLKLGIGTPENRFAATIERFAAEMHMVVGDQMDFAEILQQSDDLLTQLSSSMNSASGDFAALPGDVKDLSVRSHNQLVVDLAGGTAGDVAEFLNLAYDDIKTGFRDGDWVPLWETVQQFGIGIVLSAIMITVSTTVAYAIHPTLGRMVSAGWHAYGVTDAFQNGSELLGKITADLRSVIVEPGLLPAGEAATNLLAAIADRILANYGVGKEPPLTIGPHDFLYVIDDEDDRFPDRIQGTDDGEIFFGRNGAVILGGGGDDEIHHSGSGEVRGEDGDDQLLLSGTVGIVADGGAGNDWILSRDGEGGEFVGGLGRDWIFVKTPGAELYGDVRDNRVPGYTPPSPIEGEPTPDPGAEQEAILRQPENSDNFWWFADTTIMDARPNDVLKFFGFPLTGGTNNIPFLVSGALGLGAFSSAPGLVLAKSPLYFDNILVFMTYVKIGDDLYVTNMFDGLASLFGNYEFGEATQSDESGNATEVNIRGAMRIKDYEDVTSAWGVAILNATIRDIAAGGGTLGDLGMVFKNANPALAILQILPLPGLGGIGKVLGLVDEVTNLAAAAMRFAKSLAWAADVDPLVLDLDGDGIETIDFDDADTRVYFDDDGDFFRERTGWLGPDDGFVALDLNGNGAPAALPAAPETGSAPPLAATPLPVPDAANDDVALRAAAG